MYKTDSLKNILLLLLTINSDFFRLIKMLIYLFT